MIKKREKLEENKKIGLKFLNFFLSIFLRKNDICQENLNQLVSKNSSSNKLLFKST